MRIAALLLLVLGLAQMTGALLGIPALRGIAAATAASPAPRVFSAVNGLETYSSEFWLEWTTPDGGFHRVRITPEIYAGLAGPYNRRNAYGAVVAYGPLMADDPVSGAMFRSVAARALCGDAPLLRELGLIDRPPATPPRLELVPREGSNPGPLSLVLDAPCAP